jgi:hypothetical protein
MVKKIEVLADDPVFGKRVRETLTLESDQDIIKALDSWPSAIEEVKEQIEQDIKLALSVFEKAGYPQKRGIYVQSGSGKWQREPTLGQGMKPEKWPRFSDIAPNTKTEFASDILWHGNRLLEAINDGKQDIGTMLLDCLRSVRAKTNLLFVIQKHNDRARRELKSEAGRKQGNEKKKMQSDLLFRVVRDVALSVKSESAAPTNSKDLAARIRDEVLQKLERESKSTPTARKSGSQEIAA